MFDKNFLQERQVTFINKLISRYPNDVKYNFDEDIYHVVHISCELYTS